MSKKEDPTAKKQLTPAQQHICYNKGTEAAFSGAYLHNTEQGTYSCVACGNELFSSETKFDSGTGWPSFWDVAATERVLLRQDDSHGIHRIEVQCAHCHAHLGHVFDDGPQETTGKRYCINSLALNFEKTAKG